MIKENRYITRKLKHQNKGGKPLHFSRAVFPIPFFAAA